MPDRALLLNEQIRWFVDACTWGGVTSERLLAALPLADGLWCGLVFSFDSPGSPRVQFWERIDDLQRQGFRPIRAARARALCDALPRFLERLDQTCAALPSTASLAGSDPSFTGEQTTEEFIADIRGADAPTTKDAGG